MTIYTVHMHIIVGYVFILFTNAIKLLHIIIWHIITNNITIQTIKIVSGFSIFKLIQLLLQFITFPFHSLQLLLLLSILILHSL